MFFYDFKTHSQCGKPEFTWVCKLCQHTNWSENLILQCFAALSSIDFLQIELNSNIAPNVVRQSFSQQTWCIYNCRLSVSLFRRYLSTFWNSTLKAERKFVNIQGDRFKSITFVVGYVEWKREPITLLRSSKIERCFSRLIARQWLKAVSESVKWNAIDYSRWRDRQVSSNGKKFLLRNIS